MRIKKLLAALLTTAFIVTAFMGCAQTQGTPSSQQSSKESVASTEAPKEQEQTADQKVVSWSTWGNEGELDRFLELNDEFVKINPDITIDFRPIPNDGYDQKMLTLISSGSEPDIFYIEDSFGFLALNGKLEPLDDYLENDANISASDFFKPLIENCTYNGTIYGLPCDCAPMALYYNKTMLTDLGLTDPNDLEASGTWDVNAFRDMTQKISESGKTSFMIDNGWPFQYDWISSSAGNMYPGDGKTVMVNSPESIAIYKFLQDMVNNDYIAYQKGADSAQLFMGNQLAFVEAGRWLMPVFKNIKDFEFDICPIPKGLTGGRMVGVPSVPVVMSANSKDKESAWRFFSYFEGKEGQTLRLANSGNCIPSIDLPGLDDATFMNESLPAHKDIWQKYRAEGFVVYRQNVQYPEIFSAWKDANGTCQEKRTPKNVVKHGKLAPSA